MCRVSEFLWKGLRSCSVSQLNRPKVNKIVEILEKAKSCYWPALQNVYMNVSEGEPRKRPGRLPTHSSLWRRSWVSRKQVSANTEPPAAVPTVGGVCASLCSRPCRAEGGRRHCSAFEASADPAGGDGAGRLHDGVSAREGLLSGAGLCLRGAGAVGFLAGRGCVVLESAASFRSGLPSRSRAKRRAARLHTRPSLRSSRPSSRRCSTPSASSGPRPSTTTRPPGSSSSCRSSATKSSRW